MTPLQWRKQGLIVIAIWKDYTKIEDHNALPQWGNQGILRQN